MSLHDIDKQEDNRGLPRPNADDQQFQRMAHGTTQNQNSIEEAQADGLKFLERQIIAKDDGVNKALFGFLEDGTFGLKVAKPGFDVLTASDDDLIFNSAQNVFKIVDSGNIVLPAASLNTGGANYGFNVGATTSIAHGLSYTPAVIAFVNDGTGGFVLMPWEFQNGTTSGSFSRGTYRIAIDGTNIYGVSEIWGYNVNTSIAASSAKYYLLQETAN